MLLYLEYIFIILCKFNQDLKVYYFKGQSCINQELNFKICVCTQVHVYLWREKKKKNIESLSSL